MKIIHPSFQGSRPGIASHLLGQNEAQVCHNCKLDNGRLESFRAPLSVQALPLSSALSIFQYTENGNTHWVASANDVDAAGNFMDNDPYERLWFTGEGELRFFANDNISGGGFDPAVDYLIGGIPAPTNTPVISREGSAGSSFRAYFCNFFNRYGDCGPASPIGTISDYSSGRIRFNIVLNTPASRAIDRIRIWRTNSSSSGAEFQLVCEAMIFSSTASYAVGDFVFYSSQLYECTTAHTGAWNAAHFILGEQVPDASLGSVFAYSDYLPPPDGLSGLVVLSNGVAAGFYGNTLYISHPGKPWAYPVAYRKHFSRAIVAIKSIGTEIYVATAGNPYRVYGQSPWAMAVFDYGDMLPCVGKRTAAVWKDTLYYRSTLGLAEVGPGGARIITLAQGDALPIIDSDRWQSDFNPSHGFFYSDLYFGFNAAGGFYIDLRRRSCGTLSVAATAGCLSKVDGALYLAMALGTTVFIHRWEGDTQGYLLYTWRGRLHIVPHLSNLACGRIMLDREFYAMADSFVNLAALNEDIFAGDIGGALRDDGLRDRPLRGDDLYSLSGFSVSNRVVFQLYADGVLRHAYETDSVDEYFGLPSDYMATSWEIEVSGYAPVLLAGVASSYEELMGYGNE
jgi:hypothetical protein